MTFEPLDHAVPAPPGAPPTVSVLPHKQSGDTSYGRAYFIRTSPGCEHGSAVEALPANDTTVATTGYAWTAGNYQGGMAVPPT